MQRTFFFMMFIVWVISIMYVTVVYPDELKLIKLPNPQVEGGRPLMQVLRDRNSFRSFSSEKLPDQTLSNLLWAAFGINRSITGKRTAQSAVNWQGIDIFGISC